MKQTFKIFYSWQSDLPGKDTRNFISSAIDAAAKFLANTVMVIPDRDTKGETGSPRVCSHKLSMQILEKLFASFKAKIRKGTRVLQEFLTQEMTKTSPKATCERLCEHALILSKLFSAK